MSQSDFGTIDPNTKNGTELASDLNAFRDALNTSHRGSTRPTYAQGGTVWVDDSGAPTWVMNMFDGEDDLTLFTMDITANTVALTFDTIALTDSGTTTSFSTIRTGTPPTVNIAFIEDQAVANNFSNLEMKAHRPGIIFRDSTASADDVRLGLDGNVFKMSVDTDDDDAKDASGHFDDFTNAFVLDCTTGNIGLGREPTTQLDLGLSAAGADVRFLVENTSDTASATSTIEIKAGGTNAGPPTLLFNQGSENWGWAIDRTIDGGTESGFILFSGTDPLLNANQVITIHTNQVGIGSIHDLFSEEPQELLHLASNGGALVIRLELISGTVFDNTSIASIDFAGGEVLDGGNVVGQIRVISDEAWTASSSPARMSFFTTESGTKNVTGSEQMRLNMDGQLGVFSTLATPIDPVSDLHVRHLNAAATFALETQDTSVADDQILGQINFRGGETTLADVGQIQCVADAAWAADDSPTRVSIWTTPAASTTALEAVRVDSSQNTLFLGDITADADLLLGASGVNKVWTKYVPVVTMGVPVTNPAAAGVYENGEAIINVLDFDQTTSEFAGLTIDLGADYDGSALTFTVYWTASAGTSGTVAWLAEAQVTANDEVLGASAASIALTDTFIATNDLHQVSASAVPDSPGTGRLLTMRLRRISGSDTFDADARLIGVGISY